MNAREHTVRLFQRSASLWVLGYMVTALSAAERLWLDPVSPAWIPPGPLTGVTHLLSYAMPEIVIILAIGTLILLGLRDAVLPTRWWSALLIWFLYVNLMDRAWLAGSGGQQLMANLWFWNILLSVGRWPGLRELAFWIVRFQLIVVYLATIMHKFSGRHWLNGDALGIVATDPAFGPSWIAGFPVLAMMLTWSVLLFQLTFPFAVWWRATRRPWMVFGILFHLGTAIWMDMPEMGLAFIASYTLWLNEREAAFILEWFRIPHWSCISRQGVTGRP